MRIDYPSQEQLPQLRTLWQETFGDDDAFLDLFFSTAFSSDRCLCAEVEGQLAAALYWMDCRLEDKPLAYLYAVATSKAFRRRGICRALMEQAHRLLKQLGYATILLVPGNSQLRQMYAGMGYTDCTTVAEIPVTAEQSALALRRIGGQEYAQLRRDLLPKGSVLQEGSCLGLLEGVYSLYAGESCLLAAVEKGDRLLCSEFLGDISAAPAVLAALDKTSGSFRMPGNTDPFAMWLPLSECPTPQYFAFAFD